MLLPSFRSAKVVFDAFFYSVLFHISDFPTFRSKFFSTQFLEKRNLRANHLDCHRGASLGLADHAPRR